MKHRFLLICIQLLAACSGGDAERDAGLVDSGSPETGSLEAGPADAGQDGALDAGDAAGVDDAGSPVNDLPVVSCDVTANDETELSAALSTLAPGATVCLAAGEWSDLSIEVSAVGTATAPITIAAERAGETFLTGATNIALGGEYLVVTGLVIRDGSTRGSHLIDFRAGDAECRRCRLSNVAVIELDDSGDTKWVSLRGEDNRVDHCAFYGKTNDGALLVVWRPDGGADRHRIDHNYFAERPDLGRNGGETIRVGASDQHDSDSFTVVEDNFFFRSDGEVEVVSNKSGSNTYRRNVFVECQGLLTLRHGDSCVVEQNVFLVGGVEGGGVRIVGASHRVVNNYVEGCRTSSNVRGGIVLMLSDRSPAMNGYQLVEDVLIAHNTIVDCDQSFVFGGGRASEAPRRVDLLANLVDTRGRGDVVREEQALLSSRFEANLYFGGALGVDAAGWSMVDPQLARASGGVYRPASSSPARDGAGDGFGAVEDMDSDPRSGPHDIGADEIGVGPTRLPVTRADVGPTFDAEALRP